MGQVRRAQEARLIRRASDGVNRFVFEEEQLVGSEVIGALAGDDRFLQLKRVSETDSAEPARGDRGWRAELCDAVGLAGVRPSIHCDALHICLHSDTPSFATSCPRKWVSPMARASAASAPGVSV